MYQLWRAEVGFTLDDMTYTLPDVDSVAMTYNLKKHLMRGANAQNKKGIITHEGGTTAEVMEITVVDCPKSIYKLLLDVFNDEKRINVWAIDSKTGESITFRNAIISSKPRQTAISEDDSSHSFVLSVESFDVQEKLRNDED